MPERRLSRMVVAVAMRGLVLCRGAGSRRVSGSARPRWWGKAWGAGRPFGSAEPRRRGITGDESVLRAFKSPPDDHRGKCRVSVLVCRGRFKPTTFAQRAPATVSQATAFYVA